MWVLPDADLETGPEKCTTRFSGAEGAAPWCLRRKKTSAEDNALSFFSNLCGEKRRERERERETQAEEKRERIPRVDLAEVRGRRARGGRAGLRRAPHRRVARDLAKQTDGSDLHFVLDKHSVRFKSDFKDPQFKRLTKGLPRLFPT